MSAQFLAGMAVGAGVMFALLELAAVALLVARFRHKHKVAESESEPLYVPTEWVRS